MRRSLMIGISLILLLVVIGSASSCANQTDDPNKKQNVALVVKMKHGDYWKTVKMGAEMAAKEFGVNLNFYAPDYEEDVKGQVKLVNQALQDGTDALIVAASDREALAQATEPAGRLNVPVIAIDTDMRAAWVRSFIGTDHFDSGQKAGEKLVELIGTKGRIAIIGFRSKAGDAEQRENGLLAAIARFPEVRVVAKEYCGADQKQAEELARKIVTQYPEVDGIVALNATASIGAAEEIETMGLAGKVKIVGIDSPPEVLEYIQGGVIQATIIQKPFIMGYLGVKYAVDAINGISIPNRVDTGTKVIDVENMFWSENQKLLFPFVK